MLYRTIFVNVNKELRHLTGTRRQNDIVVSTSKQRHSNAVSIQTAQIYSFIYRVSDIAQILPCCCCYFKQIGVSPLPDNKPGDSYLYEITVYTGSRAESGTSSNVFINIKGIYLFPLFIIIIIIITNLFNVDINKEVTSTYKNQH